MIKKCCNWFQIHLDVKVVGIVFVQLHQDHGRVRWLDAVKDVEGRKKSGHSDVMSRIHEQLPIGWGQFSTGRKRLDVQPTPSPTALSLHIINLVLQQQNDVNLWLICLTSTETLHFQIVSFHLETKVGKFLHWTGKVLCSPFGQRLVETILQKDSLRISAHQWFDFEMEYTSIKSVS